MRLFYSIISIISFAISLPAQSALKTSEARGTFYITDTDCHNQDPSDGIIWPCDIETIDCRVLSSPSTTGQPIVSAAFKNQVKITFEDLSTQAISSECRNLLRKWTVTDTLANKQNSEKGTWEYTQKIRIIRSTPPVFTSESTDQEFCIYKYDCSPGFIHLKADATDDCTPEARLDYFYEIDLNNDGSIDFTGNTNDAGGIYPFGKHKITWYVKDACENISRSEYFFTIKDCMLPFAGCVNGLMVNLDPYTNQATINAKDFNLGSFDNCKIDEFRVVSPSLGDGQTTPPPANATSVTFDCLSAGVNTIDFWVKDTNGNWSYCTTLVIVQDNEADCNEKQDENQTLGKKVSRFTEEVPLEIEKILIPEEDIKQPEKSGLKIYPSKPNPFENETKIGFELGEFSTLIFIIQDISGNVIKKIEKEYFAGFHQITVNKEDFREAGIYFFTLKSKTHNATGKIILIQR